MALPSRPAEAAPRVVVLTMTPGPRTFERFGHTAVLVDDGEDDPPVYNFGTFDEDDPQLVGKFLRHELPYWLSLSSWSAMQRQYANRRVTLQELALDGGEARAVAADLADNLRPERRAYRYEFFWDNCSTRVRDAIERSTGAVREAAVARPGRATYREHAARRLATAPWLWRGIDLVLNRRVDEPLRRWDDAFLPRELEALLDEARRPGGRPLVARTSTWVGPLYRREPAPPLDPAPLVGGALAALLALAALDGGRRRVSRVVAGLSLAVWGLAAGGLGLVVVVTSLVPYEVSRWNGNLLVLSPLALLLVPYGARLAMGRVGDGGRCRMRALLLLLVALPVLDLAAHLVGAAGQHHVDLAVFAMATGALGWLAIRPR